MYLYAVALLLFCVRGRLGYGEIPSLLHSSGVVLALGADRAGALSDCVAGASAVSRGRDRCWRGARTGERAYLSSRADAKGDLKAYVSFRDHRPGLSKAEIHAFGVVPNVRRNISTKALD